MSNAEREKARLRERHEARVRAWNEYDLGALGEIYDANCLIFDAIAPPKSHTLSDFLTHLTPLLQSNNGFQLRTFDQVLRIDEKGDSKIGWITSRYEVEVRYTDGIYRRCGRWTEIYERQLENWKLTHLHSSDDSANALTRRGSVVDRARRARSLAGRGV
jgi:ketosteroid isomerase-like protein